MLKHFQAHLVSPVAFHSLRLDEHVSGSHLKVCISLN